MQLTQLKREPLFIFDRGYRFLYSDFILFQMEAESSRNSWSYSALLGSAESLALSRSFAAWMRLEHVSIASFKITSHISVLLKLLDTLESAALWRNERFVLLLSWYEDVCTLGFVSLQFISLAPAFCFISLCLFIYLSLLPLCAPACVVLD